MIASLFSVLLLDPASAAGLELRWQTEPACVETRALSGRVAQLLGSPPPEARLTLAAERRGEGWRISLELEPSGQGLHRTLEGRDCATLTEAVALVVAVQLDPVAVAGSVGWEPAVAPTVDAEPEPLIPVPPEAEEPPGPERSPVEPRGADPRPPVSRPGDRARLRPRGLLSVAAVGELGVLPRGAAAFELAGGLGWPRAQLELGGLASVGPDGVSERLATVGGRFRLFTGVLRGCGVPRRDRVELPLCGGLELGDLRASGVGVLRPSTVDALWLAAVASARPQWVLTPWLVMGARLDVLVPLRRHRFAIAEAGLVHEVDPVAVRLGVHVELRLP